MPALETVRLHRGASNGGELRIELNRPERLNAWNAQLAADLTSALELAAHDDAVRAVTITGSGRAFSAGADLRDGFDDTAGGVPDLAGVLRERYSPVILAIRRLPKPVLAAVNGPAVGIGCSLALACDLVLASESSYLLLAFVNIGLVPDGGASLLVPARAGAGRALELALLGERLPARRALEWGLVTRVAADEVFAAEVDALAEKLATGPTKAYAGAKALIGFPALEEQLEREAAVQQQMGATRDFEEGVRAFRERRDATFGGH